MIGEGNKPRDPLSSATLSPSRLREIVPTVERDYTCMLCGNVPKQLRDAEQAGYERGLAESAQPAPGVGEEERLQLVARAIAESIMKQDYEDGPLPDDWNMKFAWLDQGEVDFELVARDAIVALQPKGEG